MSKHRADHTLFFVCFMSFRGSCEVWIGVGYEASALTLLVLLWCWTRVSSLCLSLKTVNRNI